MTIQRPTTDIAVVITGMIMDGTAVETDFGFSMSGVTFTDVVVPAFYNQYFEPVISQPILLTQSTERATFGTIVLTNDGRLNHLINYSFGDRTIKIYQIEDGDWTTKEEIFSGLIDQVVVGREVQIVIKDTLTLLDAVAANGAFLGDNILPDGIEGDKDLEGQLKPRVFGRVFNVTPVLVNSARLIYGVNWDQDGNTAALDDITEVRDRGVVLPIEADVVDSATLEATSVTAGYVATCLAEGLIRLGSQPNGNITLDAQDVADPTIQNVVYAIAIEAGIDAGEAAAILTSTVAFLCPVGLYISSEASYRDIVDRILKPLDLFIWADPDANVIIDQLGAGLGEEEKLFLIEHRHSALPDGYFSILSAEVVSQTYPVYNLKFNRGENYTTQSADELAWSSREQWGRFVYQFQTYEDNRQYVKDVFKEARQEIRDTAIQIPCLTDSGESDAHAETLLDRLQYPHQHVRVSLSLGLNRDLPVPDTNQILLGDIVGLQSPYVPDSENMLYQVIEIEINARTDERSLLLEGAFGTVIFRGIETPVITPEERCYAVPPAPFTASTFATVDLAEPHLSSDWQIADDPYFFILRDKSIKDEVALETWQPTRELDPEKTYYARVRYRTANYRSRWSDPMRFVLYYKVGPPEFTDPIEGQEVSAGTVSVTTSAFVPYAAGLTHASTDWLVQGAAGQQLQLIEADTVNKTSRDLTLTEAATSLHVRYRANTGCMSAWGSVNITTLPGSACISSSGIATPVATLPTSGDEVTS